MHDCTTPFHDITLFRKIGATMPSPQPETVCLAEKLLIPIGRAQREFARLLNNLIESGGTSLPIYQRYLSMQYHLTKRVHRYFLSAASHEDLAGRRNLRRFLVDFANEEEKHYLVAANDLLELGLNILAPPLDVILWHAYFQSIVIERPFIRLGTACILENIAGGEAKPFAKAALTSAFLNQNNSRSLILHQHEHLPHGEQITAALMDAHLEAGQLQDLAIGARQGAVKYLRMANWAISEKDVSHFADQVCLPPSNDELAKISNLDLNDFPRA